MRAYKPLRPEEIEQISTKLAKEIARGVANAKPDITEPERLQLQQSLRADIAQQLTALQVQRDE